MSVLLLGPVIVGSTQRRLSPRSRSARGLLAMLALEEGQPVSPERLYQEVWGDRPSPSPITNVQVAVHRLRRWLAECGADSVRLETITGRYRLDFASETDVRRFRSLTALSAQQDPAACYRTLEDALELWRGPALADASGPGATMAAVALERELTQATTRCAQAALEIGHPERALIIATARALVDPLDEGIQAVLIDTLLATGQRAAALQTFECVRHRLATELGVDPGEALRQAHLRALHRTSCPNEISVPRPRQLPADIAEFTGRTSQLAVLREKLAQPAPVVVISGIPGVGKTTLAVHAAHLMKQDFPDGQLYAHLRGVGGHPSTPGDLLGQLLRALGRDGSAIPADVGERAALFRTETADRKILVVLDDAADEAQVRPLLPGGAGCATLITSRQRLAALPGAHRLALPVMTAAESVELLRRIVGPGRADAEIAAARRIAAQCGNLPLALRIAGCKLADRPNRRMSWLTARLNDKRRRLDELASGDLAVRSSMALSYEAAGPALRTMFRLLSLVEATTFAPWVVMVMFGVSLEHAEDCLDALARIHLLETVGHDETGQVRYGFHDLIRLYARERAMVEEEPEAIRRVVARGTPDSTSPSAYPSHACIC